MLRSDRGRVVRADWRLEDAEPPRRRAWSQALEGTPFEKVLSERRVEVRVEPAEAGSTVTLELRQRSRGSAASATWSCAARRARELDGALAQLAEALAA